MIEENSSRIDKKIKKLEINSKKVLTLEYKSSNICLKIIQVEMR